MKRELLDKAISIILILIMTFSYWGILASEVYAEYEEMESQGVQTNNKNVEFDAFFNVEDKEVHEINVDTASQEKIHMKFGVNDGYLKQINVNIDNPNFSMSSENTKIENSNIVINEVQKEKDIEISFNFEKQELIDSDYFARDTKISFSAIYVDKKGKEREVTAERHIKVNWVKNPDIQTEQKIDKVISLGDGKVLLQTDLKLQVIDNSIPVEYTKIEIMNPVVENAEIETAKIYAISTTEANGVEDGTGFSKENWEYKKDESKISVNIENTKTEDNKISWKNGTDEFKVIYILKTNSDIQGKNIDFNVNGEIVHNGNSMQFENKTQNVIEFSGELINTQYLTTESLNKGYMYANSEYETAYETKLDIEISYSDLIEEIKVKYLADNYMDKNENIISGNDSTIFKSTKISKANFDSIFGEGKIEIYSNGEKQAEINKDSEVNTEGNIVINYAEGINNIEIVTSKPIAEGKLEINNTKAIKAQTGYDVETIKGFKEIVTKAEVETNISKEEKEGRIGLNETVSKAELVMVTDNLSTVVKNENVEMRVLFRTDSNMYDLYKNPVIEIELPSQIKEVNLKSIEAAFGEGFSLRGYEIVETEEGKKVIRISLEGEQTKYAIDISEGMSIIVKTDMTLDKKSGSSEETVKLRYSNEKAIGYDNGGEAEGKVRIEAPTGVVAINSIEGYNAEGETATSLSSKEQVGELEILTDKKEATMTIDVINNYEKDIENPSILGRIPYEGNKKETGEELGSTFTAGIVRGIEKTEGIEEGNYKVYYSSNGEATAELGKAENGWTENIEEAGEVKSYLIEAEGYTMKQGEAMSFTYGIEIPEGLNHNESAYGTYAVNYEVEEAGELREEKIVAPTVGATTGAGPELEVSLEANVANEAEVEEGQIIKYSVKVKNVGSVEAKNIVAKATVPENTIYVKYTPAQTSWDVDEYMPNSTIKEFSGTISSLTAGETKTIDFYAKVKPIPEAGKILDENGNVIGVEEINNNIIMKAKVTADDLGKEIETNELTNIRITGTISIKLDSIFDQKTILLEKDTTNIAAVIKNLSESEDKHNVIATYELPEGYDFTSAEFLTEEYKNNSANTISYDEKARVLTIKVPELKNQEQFAVEIKVSISEFKDDEKERIYQNIIKAKCDENSEEKTSNIITHRAGKPILETVQTSNKEKYINQGEEIQYIVTIKNSGIAGAKNVKVEDFLPDELDYLGTKYQTTEINGETKNNSYVGCTITIPANSEAIVTIRAKGKEQDKEQVEITNSIKLSGENIKDIYVNSLNHTLLNKKQIVDDNGNTVNVYTISGTAWEDTNQDGRKDAGESKIANIGVCLVDTKTGSIATQVSSQDKQRTTTDSNGEYIFNEVKAGEYIVVFLYDATKYNLTTYKKSEVIESENSDAMKTQVKLDGETKTAGVTETIQIKDLGASGINIGLIKKESTVFGIDKVVTKMVMQNKKTSKTVNFKDSKLAKMDVDGKYINSTNLVMEYKITVKNEGSVEGYVKKIVDYVPSEFKFSADLNKDWYLGNNGEIYNTSLTNTLIKPGETKEITLILTKKMNESGDGIVHNTSAITEVYNEYGAENIINNDSTRAAADVMIGIKTGKEVTYIILTIIVILGLGIGIYYINKKVLKK